MRRAWSRSGERRRGVAELLSAIASALPGSRDPRALRQRFESALRDLLSAREVELRDGPPMPRPPQNMMSVDVRSGDYILGSIDALFEEGSCAFDDWDQHLIGMARQLAAMVLLVDRAQRGAAGASAPFARGDGAAPIVGSSAAIRAVRARIERIAATEFTVLIEGGIDAQPHPGFIEVFDAAAVRYGDREVAREGEDGASALDGQGRSQSFGRSFETNRDGVPPRTALVSRRRLLLAVGVATTARSTQRRSTPVHTHRRS